MNLSNPHGWRKRRAQRRKRLSHAPSEEVREARRRLRDEGAFMPDTHIGEAIGAERKAVDELRYTVEQGAKGWYDVVAPNGEAVNDKRLRRPAAEQLAEELNNGTARSPEAA